MYLSRGTASIFSEPLTVRRKVLFPIVCKTPYFRHLFILLTTSSIQAQKSSNTTTFQIWLFHHQFKHSPDCICMRIFTTPSPHLPPCKRAHKSCNSSIQSCQPHYSSFTASSSSFSTATLFVPTITLTTCRCNSFCDSSNLSIFIFSTFFQSSSNPFCKFHCLFSSKFQSSASSPFPLFTGSPLPAECIVQHDVSTPFYPFPFAKVGFAQPLSPFPFAKHLHIGVLFLLKICLL